MPISTTKTILLITFLTMVIKSIKSPNTCDCLSLPNPPRDPKTTISRDTSFKDYQNWSLVRVYPRTGQALKAFLDDVGSNANANVISVRRSKAKFEVDLAISPSVTLNELLTSKDIPELCCLDDYVQKYAIKHPKNINLLKNSGPGGEVVKEILQNHVFNLSDCSFNNRRNSNGKKFEVEGEESRSSRSSHLIEWATLIGDFGSFFSREKQRQLDTTGELNWDRFYRYDSIKQFSKNLANSSKYVGYISIGYSHEGRELFALAFATNITSIMQRYTRKSPVVDKLLARGGPRFQQQRLQANDKTRHSMPYDIRAAKQINGIDGMERKKNGNNKESVSEREKGDEKMRKMKELKKNKKNQTNSLRQKAKKPVLLIEAGTHAREWISTAVGTYIAQQLSLAGKSFLKHVTIILVPLVNPDGYEYTHVYDRMWRKNRRTGPEMDGCVGVDLNRNWNISWGDEEGTSTDPCSFQFCGESAFSEPETSALRNLTGVYLYRLQAFISLHSYGQFLLHPWGHTVKKPPKHGKLKSMGKRLLFALNTNGGALYTAGQSSWLLYQSSGTADDYMYSLGVPYSYTLELPGTDSFELPANQIHPTAEDIWSSLVCFLGDVIGTKSAKSFCSKKLVTVTTENNVTVSSWVDKTMPTAAAKAILLENVRRKNRNDD